MVRGLDEFVAERAQLTRLCEAAYIRISCSLLSEALLARRLRAGRSLVRCVWHGRWSVYDDD